MALDKACTAHRPPTESAHCFNLGARGKEEHRATKRNMEDNCGGRKTEDGFCQLYRRVNVARDGVEWRKQINGSILSGETDLLAAGELESLLR